jgi:hypothetical protein
VVTQLHGVRVLRTPLIVAALGVLSLVCACVPGSARPSDATPVSSSNSMLGWHVMRHIKLATFSASDPGEYEVMIFCDPPAHVVIYHFARPEALGAASDLKLQSGREQLVLQGERQEVRVTPPPLAPGPEPLLGYRVMVRLERNAAVLAAFLHSGALEVRSGAQLTHADAGTEERADLVSFFKDECQ